MSSEQKEEYTELLEFLLKLMEFFTKTPNPEISLVKTMIPYIEILLSMLPDRAEDYFTNIDNPKYLEVLLSHSDSPIRDLYRTVLNRCFNIVLQRKEVRLNDPTD